MATKTTLQPPAREMSTLVKAGTKALEDGDLITALSHFEDVVQKYPDRPEGHNNLGALYNALGENDKAETCFSRVIDMLADKPELRYNRGVVRSRLGKFDAARADFQSVLDAKPRDTETLNNLGVMDFMQGRLVDASARFRACLEIRPDYTNALLNLIDAEQALGNGPTAVQLCEDFLKKQNDLEVRRKLLELLSSGCREALDKASQVAETLVKNDDTAASRQKWNKLRNAQSAMAADAV